MPLTDQIIHFTAIVISVIALLVASQSFKRIGITLRGAMERLMASVGCVVILVILMFVTVDTLEITRPQISESGQEELVTITTRVPKYPLLPLNIGVAIFAALMNYYSIRTYKFDTSKTEVV